MQLTNLREEQATAAKAREGAVRLSAHASHSHPSAHHTPDPYPLPVRLALLAAPQRRGLVAVVPAPTCRRAAALGRTGHAAHGARAGAERRTTPRPSSHVPNASRRVASRSRARANATPLRTARAFGSTGGFYHSLSTAVYVVFSPSERHMVLGIFMLL